MSIDGHRPLLQLWRDRHLDVHVRPAALKAAAPVAAGIVGLNANDVIARRAELGGG